MAISRAVVSQQDEQLILACVCRRVRRRRTEKDKSSWLHRRSSRSRSRSPPRNNDRHRDREHRRDESHRYASSSQREERSTREHRSTREDKEPRSQADKEELAKQRREKENAELDEEVNRRRKRIETWQVCWTFGLLQALLNF